MCRPKQVWLDLQKDYGNSVYPVCPTIKHLVKSSWESKDQPRSNTGGGLSALQCIINIGAVLCDLVKCKPDKETIHLFAYDKHFLDVLAGIQNDLSALPQLLEKDFPDTSKEMKELIAQLKNDVSVYDVNQGYLAYLIPSESELRYFSHPLHISDWRKRALLQAEYFKGGKGRVEMMQLTNTYPAEIIYAARKICEKLIVPAELLAKNPEVTDSSGGVVPDDKQEKPKASFMSMAELVEHFKIDRREALRKRLQRFREKNTLNADAFIESENRGANKPKYLYNVDLVSPIIADHKRTKTSVRRPTGKNMKN